MKPFDDKSSDITIGWQSRKIFEMSHYFRKSIELQTFNKFAVNIVSINFLGLNRGGGVAGWLVGN